MQAADSQNPNVNLDVRDRAFKYYIFDWDNNILHMPTRIHLERKRSDGVWEDHAVSTSVYSVVRNDPENYRPPKGNWEQAFREFRDFAHEPESKFLIDTKSVLAPIVAGKKSGGPSFEQFRSALIEGRLFAIVTARGHKSETLREGVRYFIDQVLTDGERVKMLRDLRGYRAVYANDGHGMSDDEVIEAYLDLNRFHAVTSPEFLARMGVAEPNRDIQEEAKQFAIKDFVTHAIGIVQHCGADRPISVGFSDDDPRNVDAVEAYIEHQLHREFPGVKFVVYDTSDPDVPDGRKIVVTGQLELEL